MTGRRFTEQHLLPGCRGKDLYGPLTEPDRRADRFLQSPAKTWFNHQAIDNRFNGMAFILFKRDIRRERDNFAIDPNPDIALFAQLLKYQFMPPLFPNDKRSQQNNFFALRSLQQDIHHVFNGLGTNGVAALGTMGLTGPGKEKP